MSVKYFDNKTNSWKIFPGTTGLPGKDGKDCYEVAKENGYTGTREDYEKLLANLGNLETEFSNLKENTYDSIKSIYDTVKSLENGQNATTLEVSEIKSSVSAIDTRVDTLDSKYSDSIDALTTQIDGYGATSIKKPDSIPEKGENNVVSNISIDSTGKISWEYDNVQSSASGITKEEADGYYQPKGEYQTTAEADGKYLTKTEANSYVKTINKKGVDYANGNCNVTLSANWIPLTDQNDDSKINTYDAIKSLESKIAAIKTGSYEYVETLLSATDISANTIYGSAGSINAIEFSGFSGDNLESTCDSIICSATKITWSTPTGNATVFLEPGINELAGDNCRFVYCISKIGDTYIINGQKYE